MELGGLKLRRIRISPCLPFREISGFSFVFVFVCLFAFSRAALAAYGGSQARGRIGAVATSLHQSHNNAGSEQHLQPTP